MINPRPAAPHSRRFTLLIADQWRLVGREDELRAILSLGAHGDERQRDKTRDIVNLLAAKGHSNFLDLVTQGAA